MRVIGLRVLTYDRMQPIISPCTPRRRRRVAPARAGRPQDQVEISTGPTGVFQSAEMSVPEFTHAAQLLVLELGERRHSPSRPPSRARLGDRAQELDLGVGEAGSSGGGGGARKSRSSTGVATASASHISLVGRAVSAWTAGHHPSGLKSAGARPSASSSAEKRQGGHDDGGCPRALRGPEG